MRRILAIAVLALFAAPAVQAEEVRLGVQGTVEYDDNIFNSDTDATDDVVVRAGPILMLRRKEGQFVYDVRYEPRFETFVDDTAEDAWDHAAYGSATWQMTPRTSLEATNRFLITRSLNRAGFIADPASPDVGPVTEIEVTRQKITQNLVTLALTHVLTPRVTLSANGSYNLFRTDREDRFDSDVYAASAQANYVLSGKDRVGGGFGMTYQEFQPTETQDGNETLFYRLFATWFHAFDPTFTLSVQGGPTFVDAQSGSNAPSSQVVQAFPFEDTESGGLRFIDSTTCPTNDDNLPYLADRCGLLGAEFSGPIASFARRSRRTITRMGDPPDPDIRTTIFANIELQKRWKYFRALGRFRRSDSTSSGVGQSTVLNFLEGILIWEPDDDWRVLVGGSWSSRESATDQTANGIGLAPPTAVVGPGGALLFTASPSTTLLTVESDNFVDVITYQARLTVTRFFGKEFSWLGNDSQVFFRYLYLNQSSEGATTSRAFENHRVMIGVRVYLDWMRL